MSLDLARTSIFLDFDGTITTRDTGVYLLERAGRPGWRELDEAYDRGEIGSLECMVKQWACLPVEDETLLRRISAEVPLEPGLHDLLAFLKDERAEVTILSDGFGFYASQIAEQLGVRCLTNAVDWSSGEMRFPNRNPDCECALCGTCKRAPMEAAKARGRTIVFVGDGISDRRAADLADWLFAKDLLASWCDEQRLAYTPFATLSDVAAAVAKASGKA
ncbi:MAG: HAD-IB family phosphatase [Chloroflexi bacterium]|nr:HAD-IB family phosphatase [Chloroflexota bacterium]